MEAAQDRLIGYRKALRKAGSTMTTGWSRRAADADLGLRGHAAAAGLARAADGDLLPERQDGLGLHDGAARGGPQRAGRYLRHRYDDEELARHLRPQLTTLDLPHRAMGAWAVRRLDHPPAAEALPHAPHKVACAFIERATVAPPRHPTR